jgi:hypothetical protein
MTIAIEIKPEVQAELSREAAGLLGWSGFLIVDRPSDSP